MNNTLNINRLWKVIKHDGYTFYHKFGLTLAIMFGIPIGIWFINYISAEIGQTGISRYSILNTIASITMILAPARIYRDCNDPRKGIGFATMPASSLEKFISMFFYCIIVTPIIFWAGSIIIDTLLVLIPCKNPYKGFLTNNLFVFKDLIEQAFSQNEVDPQYAIYFEDIYRLFTINRLILIKILKVLFISSVFMLGNMIFKKHKTTKTIGVMLIISIIALIVTIKLTLRMEEFFNGLDDDAIVQWIISAITNGYYIATISISVITIGLFAGTYFKIKKQRY